MGAGPPPLFAADRVIAATLAVGFGTLTTIGAIAVAMARSSTQGGLATAGIGLTLTAIAATMLARTYRAGLLARQHELQQPSTSPNPNANNANEDTEAAEATEGATMTTRNRPPIGPLALAMRHRNGSTNRRIAVAAIILGLVLVAGVALLLR